ncbi:chemokine (C motif) receptor 1a, duplicate 1 [Melanotaenia boesemani]|uniref:chemokine (C motif) receptor 1a, duplicate 1 n=1 Tax=Melanotaenia boesemani TaxID=1250792 RepID=UPI001C03D498|nr:chemokine (C motif) receptor 1a, duplicate 1 [Melanotaenia boesemani]
MNFSFNDSDYDIDYSDDMCEKDMVVKFGSIATPIFFSLVIALSLTGNILVLVILGLYENLKSLTNIFILNLAISDLVFTTGLPFWAIYHIFGWIFSELICKIVTFVFFTGFYSSILFLTIMTIYRYLAVVHPLSDLSTPKLRTGIFLSFLMWMVSIAAAMPSLLYSSLILIHHNNKNSLGCEYSATKWKSIGISEQNVFFLVAFTVMTFCYIQILRRITGAKSHTKNRAVKLVLCIVAVFFVGWVPYNVVIFLKGLADSVIAPFDDCKVSIHLDYAYHVCRLIAFSHCCLNPVFYAFVGVKFRRHLKTILHQMLRRRSPVEEQQVRMQNLMSHGSMY